MGYKETAEGFDSISVFGGNQDRSDKAARDSAGAYYDDAVNSIVGFKEKWGEGDDARQRYIDDSIAKSGPGKYGWYTRDGKAVDPRVAKSMDDWAAQAARARQPGFTRDSELDASRGSMAGLRQRQLESLRAAMSAPTSTQHRATASRNKMSRALGNLAARDPSLALRARASGGEELLERAMGANIGEQMGRNRDQVVKSAGIRGQDLRRAGMEQQLLGQDILAQSGREKQALGYYTNALKEAAAAQDAQAELALLEAQTNRGNSIDFMRDVFPGLLNMGAQGATAAAMMPGQQTDAQIDASFDKWLAGMPGAEPTGADLGMSDEDFMSSVLGMGRQ